MKKILKFLGVVLTLCLVQGISSAHAQQANNIIKLQSNAVIPIQSNWTLGNSSTNGVFNNITLSGICTGCGGGGSGSGGGTWSTTTSQVAGRLVNYPNNATDIVNIGSVSTTTGKFWFDPNTLRSYLVNASTTNITISSNSYLGTIMSGLWNGTTIGIAYGGTGLNSTGASSTVITTDGIVNKYNKLSPGNFTTANVSQWTNDANYLTGNQTVTLTGDVTGSGSTAITTAYNGTVPINKGGTNRTTIGASSTVALSDGTNYQFYKLAPANFVTPNVSQWTNDAGYGTGSVTAISCANTNGLNCSSSGGATPQLTLSTTISGILKGNATAISAAANGTDYTLITANTCSAGSHFSGVTAAGVFTCTSDTGGGGGASGGTWSTTTSNVAGQLINYSNNTTDIAVVGANSTTTAKFYFDPNKGLGFMSGNLTVGDTVTASKFTATSTTASTFPYASTTALSASGSAYFATGAGNVGVGTNAPSEKLTVSGAGGTRILLTDSSSFVALRLNSTGDTASLDYAHGGVSKWGSGLNGSSDSYNIWDASLSNQNIITIPQGAGKVGFGSSSPAQILSVQGNALISGDITSVANITATGTVKIANLSGAVSASGGVLSAGTLAIANGGTNLTAVGASSTVLMTDGSINRYLKLSPANFTTPNISQWTNDSGYITSATANVISVSNSDGTLTISPTTGNVVSSLALGHANFWTGLQNFTSASSTSFSSLDGIFVGRTSTTTIKGDGATSTFSNGINLTAGCITYQGGACMGGGGGSGSGTVNSGPAGYLAYYNSTGTAVSPTSTNPLYVDAIVASSSSKVSYVANKFGVGTTSPSNGSTLGVIGTSTFNGDMVVGNTGAAGLVQDYSGNVGIATSTPWAPFSTQGRVAMNGLSTSGSAQTGYICYGVGGELIQDSTACLVSALKFKKDIHDLGPALDEVMKIRPVSYYKKTPLDANDSHEQVGVIADEVEKIDRRLVSYDVNGDIHGFRYDEYTAILTKAIQELDIKVQNTATRAEENWQWLLIALLGGAVIYQGWQIKKIKR